MRSISLDKSSELISLDSTLRKFWAVKELAPTIVTRDPEEIQCETIYNETTCHSETGRYTVKLRFHFYLLKLGNLYRIALQCLMSL